MRKITILSPSGLLPTEAVAINEINNAMPNTWKGYASFFVNDGKKRGMEIDLLLVTGDRLILCELKNWFGSIESDGTNWNQIINGRVVNRHPSPVGTKRTHAERLQQLLGNELQREWGCWYNINCMVIMTGSATFELKSSEKQSVVSLNDFIKIIKNQNFYQEKLPELNLSKDFYSKNKRPNHPDSLKVLDKWFTGTNTKVTKKTISACNFSLKEDEPIFKQRLNHPIYSEYMGVHKEHVNKQSLMRIWDFRNNQSEYALTTENRANLALRESRTQAYIENQYNFIKQNYLLDTLHSFDPDLCGEDLVEVYKVTPNYERIDKYLSKNKFNYKEKLNLIQKILTPFSSLHTIQVAHRDISLERLWYDNISQSVLISGFITAKFAEIEGNKSIADVYKDFLSTPIVPFEVKDNLNDDIDPYKIDVFQLGILCYEVLFGKKLYVNNSDDYYIEWVDPNNDDGDKKINDWLKKSIELIPDDRYKNVSEMLINFNNILNGSKKNDEEENVVGQLDVFKNETLIPMIEWVASPNSQKQKNGSFEYKSFIKEKDCFVNIYTGLNFIKEKTISLKLLSLMRKCRDLSNSDISIPRIENYGWTPNFGAYIVTEAIDLKRLSEFSVSEMSSEIKHQIIISLINNIIKIQDLNYFHGDLKPDNILISINEEGGAVFLIDLFDINLGDSENYNNEYSKDINSTGVERDIYACYKIAYELIKDDSIYEYVKEKIESSIFNEEDNLPLSLVKLKEFFIEAENIENKLPNLNFWHFSLKNRQEFLSDQGKYYICFFKESALSSYKNDYSVTVTGKDSELVLRFKFSSENGKLINCEIKNLKVDEVFFKASKANNSRNLTAQEINAEIRIEDSCETDLIEYIQNLPSYLTFIAENFESINLEEVDEVEENLINGNDNLDVKSLKSLWKKLLDSEAEIKPSIEVVNSEYDEDKRVLIFEIIANGIDISDYEDDIIEVINSENNFNYGQLNIVDSDFSKGILIIESKLNKRSLIKNLPKVIRFTTRQESSSQFRRKKALDRVLKNESVIPNLLDFFSQIDANENLNSDFSIPLPSGELLALYESRLQPKQLEAFNFILKNKVSVVMGPPGTGKTTLLGHLLDYLNRVDGVSRILIVSQSNVAVDELAVKARKAIGKITALLGDGNNIKDPTIVRLGQKEKVSEELLDIHVDSLQSQYRTKFHREFDRRLLAFSERLYLSQEFVLEALDIYYKIGREIFEYHDCKKQSNELQSIIDTSSNVSSQIIEKHKLVTKQQVRVKAILLNKLTAYTDDPETLLTNPKPIQKIYEELAFNHRINDPMLISKFVDVLELTHDWLNRLSSDSGGFASFMANSRNWIVGTLVGIGKPSYQIVDKQYDLVIIDEAGRASASELAMAMQSAKKVVLVGDHLQLPPLYDKKMLQKVARNLNLPLKEVKKTDFERALIATNGIMLDDQFRMAPEIGAIVSEVFYEKILHKKLNPARGNADTTLFSFGKPWNKVVTWIDTSAKQTTENNENKKISNKFEVDLICKLLVNLFKNNDDIYELMDKWLLEDNGNPPIGIITGYAGQVLAINMKFDTNKEMSKLKKYVRVDTIDAYQGSENRIIILSLVRHNTELKTGFMNDISRINVAISRAKERLVFIGAAKMWESANIKEPLAQIYKMIKEKYKDDCEESIGYQVINSKDI